MNGVLNLVVIFKCKFSEGKNKLNNLPFFNLFVVKSIHKHISKFKRNLNHITLDRRKNKKATVIALIEVENNIFKILNFKEFITLL